MAYINGKETLFSSNVNIGAGVEIVQKTGASETAVMSQKAATDNFVTKSDFVKGKTKLVNTDIAYTKDIHANTAPYAKIVKIGGMTYKDGDTLKSAPVTEVESVGANLFNIPETVEISSTKSINMQLPTGTYTLSVEGIDNIGASSPTIRFPKSEVWVSLYTDKPQTVTLSVNESIIHIYSQGYSATSGVTVKLIKLCLNKGSTALPYRPYTKNTLAIPEAVQAIEGYGQSNPDNAEEYNYIDLKNERFAAYGHLEGGVWRAYGSVQYTPIKLDGFIGVEGNGSLTFVNAFGYDVPSEVNIYIDTNGGTGTGDMSTAVYDPNGNGIVDKAEKDGNGNNIVDTYATITALNALIARVAALESGGGSGIGVGTDVTGRTIRVTCVTNCEQSDSGEDYDVLDFGNGNKIVACVEFGYYQGYGAFDGIYDRSDFEAVTYNGGGTIAVYNKNYILLEDV